MFTHLYKIAGKKIEISSLYEEVHALCRDYRTTGKADFSVRTEPGDTEYEKSRCLTPEIAALFSDSYLETLAVYRKITEKMRDYSCFLFHGSAVAADGQTYLFTARSGTGKSTHTKLWREVFGTRAVMVNDDKPLLEVTANGIVVHGTPWNGKHRLGSNISLPLHALCILQRGQTNEIHKISKDTAYPFLMQQVYMPDTADALDTTLYFIDKLCETTPLYLLHCNMEKEAAEIAYNGMKEG